ncbi:hypothetical protein AB3X91_27805 [Paraburkholderia sp. BR14263]|uniref:hypothetical protein n=1 Tax=unclassified Paraburkholderia TaxID=2615204 RepID=UPI0034CE3C76
MVAAERPRVSVLLVCGGPTCAAQQLEVILETVTLLKCEPKDSNYKKLQQKVSAQESTYGIERSERAGYVR